MFFKSKNLTYVIVKINGDKMCTIGCFSEMKKSNIENSCTDIRMHVNICNRLCQKYS